MAEAVQQFQMHPLPAHKDAKRKWLVQPATAADTLSVKEAALLANAHSANIYLAITRGLLKAQRRNNRIVVCRDSFEAYRKRLEAKRQIRHEEERDHASSTEVRA